MANKYTLVLGFLQGLTVVINVKHLEECLAKSKYSVYSVLY